MSCGDLVHGSETTRGRHEGIRNITIVSRRVPKVLIRKNAIRACSGASTFKVPGGGSNPPAPPPGPCPTLRCPFLGPNFPPSSDPRPSVLSTCWGFLLPPPLQKKKLGDRRSQNLRQKSSMSTSGCGGVPISAAPKASN